MSFKSSMANYYHEARAQVKKIKTLQEEGKRRAERRAELIAPVAPNPHQQLSVAGTVCKLFAGADAHAANEAGDNLVPWNADTDNMIDRFDVRALLDFYKEPDPRVIAARQKSHEEQKLEETLRFESYRDLVRLMARGVKEAQGLALVEQERLDRRAAEHVALQAATEAVYNNPKPSSAGGPGMTGPGGIPAGTGMYSAMGFSYDNAAAGPAGGAAVAGADSDSDSDADSEDDDYDAAAGAEALTEDDVAQEAEDDRVDEIAEFYGLQDFTYRLHRTMEKEGEEEARMRKRPKKRMSRKKAANRAKRMAGMGLNPSTGLPFNQHDPYSDPRALINPWEATQRQTSPDRLGNRRGSPTYEGGGWRSRDSSMSPRNAPGDRQYITEFFGHADDGQMADDRSIKQQAARAGIIEALPDRPDPAMLGGIQPVAREVLTVQGIKRQDLHKQLKQASEDEDVPTYRRTSPSPSYRISRRASSRSRSRSRSHGRGSRRRSSPATRRRASSRSLTPPRYSSKRASSRSRSRSRDRYCSRVESYRRHSSRSRSRSRDGLKDRDGGSRQKDSRHDNRRISGEEQRYGGRASYGAAAESGTRGDRVASAGGNRAGAVGGGGSVAATGAATPAAGKETPQERLKRLMQAQLNKAAQKESLATAHKRIQLEKEKVARQQLERAAMSAGRGRDRSPSPEGARSEGRYGNSSRRSYSP